MNITFKEFLEEKLITFGGIAYPKFDNVVILAGGSGSGKGTILNHLLGITGKVLDVDQLKTWAIKSHDFKNRIKNEMGIDVTKMNLKNPEDTSKLHEIIEKYQIMDKKKEVLFLSIITKSTMKPNLIFDVTLKNISKLHNLTQNCEKMGYLKQNIHIVWVINDFEVALKQNLKRDRVVYDYIVKDTHIGASMTMREVVDMGDEIKHILDGDIWFVFNNPTVDLEFVERKYQTKGRWNVGEETPSNSKMETRKVNIKNALYFPVKRQGGSILSYDEFKNEYKEKIIQYVPNQQHW